MIDLLDWETMRSFHLEASYVVSAIRSFAAAAGCVVMGGWALVAIIRH